MSDINSYNCTGRLGADPETRYAASGTTIWSCRLAVNYGYGDNEGTNWLRVVAFGKRAEGLGKLDLAKGDRIGVTGELRIREFDRKDGTKGTSVEVAAQDIALLGGRQERQTPVAAPTPKPQAQEEAFVDDDLPF